MQGSETETRLEWRPERRWMSYDAPFGSLCVLPLEAAI